MARIRLQGDASGLIAEQRKARDSARQLDAEFNKMVDTNKALERQVKKTWQEGRTPLEKYNERLKRLHQLEREGRISKDQLTTALGRTKDAFERAFEAQNKTFGQRSLMRVGEFVTGMLSVQLGVDLVTEAFKRLEQQQEQLAQQEITRAAALAPLAQLPGGPAAFERRAGQAIRFEAAGAPIERAANMLFQLVSAEQNTRENREMMARTLRSRILGQDTSGAVEGATTAMNNFRDELQTLEQGLNAMQAASGTTKATLTELADGLATAAPSAAQMNFTFAETAAAQSTLTDTLKNATVAGEKLNQLNLQIAKSGERDFDVRSDSLSGALDKVQEALDKGAQLFEIFPESNAQIAASLLLRNREMMRGFEQEIRQGITGGGFLQALSTLETSRFTGPAIRRAEVMGEIAVQRIPEGQRRLAQETASDLAAQRMRERGATTFGQAMGEMGQAAGVTFGAEEEAIGITGTIAQFGAEATMVGVVASGFQRVISALNGVSQNTQPTPTTLRPEN